MTRRRHLGAAFAVALLVVPAIAVAQDLEGARNEVQRLEGELASAAERYEQVRADTELAHRELLRLEEREDELRRDAARLAATLEERAREVFKRGSLTSLELVLAATGPDAAIERAALAEALQGRDAAGLEQAQATRIALGQTVALADRRREQLELLEDELAEIEQQLGQRLELAQERVDALEAVVARQRRIDRGTQQGVYACPLRRGTTHFVNSWGFPRSGGRSHKGADVMGSMGAPVYAFTGGVIERHTNNRLGGISLYLRGDDGSTYYYAHLQGYAPAGAVGRRVVAGEHIAFNGDSGNARGGAPHIHFERHPGGGAAVNPYPYLAAACF